jgi:hypothetical protein
VADVTFCGETFAVPERVAALPLMRFADIATRGVETDSIDGLAAMYQLLQTCFTDEDWARFQHVATVNRSTHEDLWKVVEAVFEAAAERPTERPSESSDGPADTAPSSTDDSSSRVILRFEQEGRPAWALMARQAQESRAS